MSDPENSEYIYNFLKLIKEEASSYYDIKKLVEQEKLSHSDNVEYVEHLNKFLLIVQGSYRISKIIKQDEFDSSLVDEVTRTILHVLNKKFENR